MSQFDLQIPILFHVIIYYYHQGWPHDLWGPVQNQNAEPRVGMRKLVSSWASTPNTNGQPPKDCNLQLGCSWFLGGGERQPLMSGTEICHGTAFLPTQWSYGACAQSWLLLHSCPGFCWGRRWWWNVGFPQPRWPSQYPGARQWRQSWARPRAPGVRSGQQQGSEPCVSRYSKPPACFTVPSDFTYKTQI